MRVGLAALVLLGAGLSSAGAGRQQPAHSPAPVHLGVQGRNNATPSIDALGEFVAVAWGAGTKEGGTDVFVAVSRDGGARFADPVQANATPGEARLGGEMPPRVRLRRARGAADPDITVLWTARGEVTTIKLARSRDGGRTFGGAQILSAGKAGDRGWPALALDAAGTAHAIWLDHRGLADSRTGAHAHRTSAPSDGVAMAQRSGLFFASAGPSGARGERELVKGVCYCCKTALAAGRGRAIYAAWRQVYPGNIRDIAFSASRDGGRTFSAPIRISEDGWEINGCPDDGPAMAVEDDGTVHVVWPTVMVSNGALEGALFHASTRNGRTFTRRTRVPTAGSPKPSHPQLAIADGGGLIVAWDEVVAGRRTVFARTLTPKRAGEMESGPLEILSGDRPGTYPALAAAAGSVLAAWTAGGSGESTIAVGAADRKR
ncbi:MAG: hypothetical protein ACRD1U_18790 [Vicinamibacterales bacterium]